LPVPEPAEPAEPDPADPGDFFCMSLLEPDVLPDPAEPLELLPADEPLVPLVPPLPAGRSQAERVAARARAKARDKVRFMDGLLSKKPGSCNKRAGP
jgi:hypothetical protein